MCWLFCSGMSGLYLPRLSKLLHGQRREEAGGLCCPRESPGADSPHAGNQPHQYHGGSAPRSSHQLSREHPSQRHHGNGGTGHSRLSVGGGTWQQGLRRFTGDAVRLLRSVSQLQRTFLAAPAPPAGRAWDLQGQSQNKAATVTGASLLAAWKCTMRVGLHTGAERKQEQRRCSVTVCAEISFQLRHLCSMLGWARLHACLRECVCACMCVCVWRERLKVNILMAGTEMSFSSETVVIYIKQDTFCTWSHLFPFRRFYMLTTNESWCGCIQPQHFHTQSLVKNTI